MKWMLDSDHTLMTTTVSVICISMVKDVEVILRAREAELHDQCLKMSENGPLSGHGHNNVNGCVAARHSEPWTPIKGVKNHACHDFSMMNVPSRNLWLRLSQLFEVRDGDNHDTS
jgi:hypothetical protein